MNRDKEGAYPRTKTSYFTYYYVNGDVPAVILSRKFTHELLQSDNTAEEEIKGKKKINQSTNLNKVTAQQHT